MKQNQNENVQLYAERLYSAFTEAYPNKCDTLVIVQQMINIFIDGLYDDNLKLKVMRDEPKTFQDAISIATKEQNIRKRLMLRKEEIPVQRSKSEISNQFKISEHSEYPMEIDHCRPKQIKCSRCKKLGHESNSCRTKFVNELHNQSNRVFSKNRGSVGRTPKRSGVCWLCGQYGHWRRECSKRASPTLGYEQGN